MKIRKKIISAVFFIIPAILSCYEGAARNNPNDPYNMEIAYPESALYGENLLRKSYIEIE